MHFIARWRSHICEEKNPSNWKWFYTKEGNWIFWVEVELRGGKCCVGELMFYWCALKFPDYDLSLRNTFLNVSNISFSICKDKALLRRAVWKCIKPKECQATVLVLMRLCIHDRISSWFWQRKIITRRARFAWLSDPISVLTFIAFWINRTLWNFDTQTKAVLDLWL